MLLQRYGYCEPEFGSNATCTLYAAETPVGKAIKIQREAQKKQMTIGQQKSSYMILRSFSFAEERELHIFLSAFRLFPFSRRSCWDRRSSEIMIPAREHRLFCFGRHHASLHVSSAGMTSYEGSSYPDRLIGGTGYKTYLIVCRNEMEQELWQDKGTDSEMATAVCQGHRWLSLKMKSVWYSLYLEKRRSLAVDMAAMVS